jgi:hypothetical protein
MTQQPNSSGLKQYIFTKETLNDPLTNTDSSHSQLCLYKIIDNGGNIAAQFHYYPKKQFIEIDGKEMTVSVIEKFFKKTQYLLIHNNQSVGEYKFIDSSMRLFWNDVPSEPNGILTFNDKVFNFRRIPAAVRALRFKKDTWGHFKFRLYAVKGDMYAEYMLKMPQFTWQRFGFINHLPFTGSIETNTDNIMVVVSAFYLMERVFETLDDTDSVN